MEDSPGVARLFSGWDELGLTHYFQHLPDAIIVGDTATGEVQFWNDAAERLLGYSKAEIVGCPIERLIPPGLVSRQWDGLAHQARTGHEHQVDALAPVELPAVHRSGQIVTVELSLAPLESLTQPGRYVLAIVRDAMERKRALDAAHERLLALVEASGDSVIGLNLAGIVESWNIGAEHAFGYTCNEVRGRPVSIIVPPSLHPELKDWLARVALGERIVHQETVRVRKDGKLIQVAVSANPIHDETGAIVGIETVCRDITERVQAESALWASEARYRLLVEQLPAVVYLIANNSRTTPVDMSPGVIDLLGSGARDAFFANEWLSRIHPDDYPRVEAEVRRSTIGNMPWHIEYRFRRDDGAHVWLRDESRLVHDERGAPVARQGILFDVTAQHELNAQLELARDAAEESNRLKSAFLSTMSHELRTPLNAIMGYGHILLDGMAGPLTDDQQDATRQITDGADRLLGIINDVLDLSRIESGGIVLIQETVDIRDVISTVIADLRPAAAARGIALVLDVPPDAPEITGDKERIRQILLNLAGNAVKFTEQGSVTIRLEVEPDWVAIAVQDTGIGIDAHLLPVIFEEFRQADARTTRKYGGSGLGLAIARRLAELHGGTITVASTPGAGSTFTLRAPRDASQRFAKPE